MKNSWVQRAPLLLLGLADLALGAFLLWKSYQGFLMASDPVEAIGVGLAVLAGLLTWGMGLPALLFSGLAGRRDRAVPKWVMLIALGIGGLPWAGVAYFS